MMFKKIGINPQTLFALFVVIFLLTFIFASANLPAQAKKLPLAVALVTLAIATVELTLNIKKQLKADGRDETNQVIDIQTVKHIGISLAFMTLMVCLWNILGYVIASIVVIFSYACYLGAKNKIVVAISCLLVTQIMYYVFGRFIGVPLPEGILHTMFL